MLDSDIASSVADTCLIGKDVDAIISTINIQLLLRSILGSIWSPYALKCTHQCLFCTPDGAAGGVVHCLRGPAALGKGAQGAQAVDTVLSLS